LKLNLKMKKYSTYIIALVLLICSQGAMAFVDKDDDVKKEKEPNSKIEKVDSIEVNDVSTEDTLVFGDYDDDHPIGGGGQQMVHRDAGATTITIECLATLPHKVQTLEKQTGMIAAPPPVFLKSEFAIYPNPAVTGENLFLNLPDESKNPSVTLLNMLGEQIAVSLVDNAISTVGLAAGQYIAIVKLDREVYTKRVILR